MRRLRVQLLIIITALTVVAIVLLNRPVEDSVTPSVTIPPTQETVLGGLYSEALLGTPSRLNPLLDFYNPADRDVNRLLYSSLVRFDDRGFPTSDLAESWGISQDGLVYNFSIRQDARWHDGEPVTTRDILYTIEMLRNTALPIPEDLGFFWRSVIVEVLDDYLIQFRLPEPFSPFLDYLTFGILPAHLLEAIDPADLIDAPFNLSPVGSGPFQFSQFLSENGLITGVVLSRNESFYGDVPFLETINFQYFSDSQAALEAYQSGEVLGISRIDADILSESLSEPSLSLFSGRLPQLTLILLNLDNPGTPFIGELPIRQALLLALNRQRLVDQYLQGQAILADGPIFPGTWAYFDGVERVLYDPDAAINILKAAEYSIPAEGGPTREKDGVALEFTLLHPDDEYYSRLAAAIKTSWDQIGFDVALEAVPYEELVSERLALRNYDAALVDLNLFRSPDPDPYPFWHQAQINGGQNYSQWDDRPASEYLEQARVTLNIEERGRLYRNFQVRFTRELPALPLFYPIYTYGVDSSVKGVSMGPLFDPSDRLATAQYWFIEE